MPCCFLPFRMFPCNVRWCYAFSCEARRFRKGLHWCILLWCVLFCRMLDWITISWYVLLSWTFKPSRKRRISFTSSRSIPNKSAGRWTQEKYSSLQPPLWVCHKVRTGFWYSKLCRSCFTSLLSIKYYSFCSLSIANFNFQTAPSKALPVVWCSVLIFRQLFCWLVI